MITHQKERMRWFYRYTINNQFIKTSFNKPGNLLLIFPQGKLESNHVRHIQMKRGITEIIPKIKGDCQLLWSTNLIEYFESLKPSVYFHMLDCDTNKEFDFDKLHEKINIHHKAAIQKQLRFTRE